MRITRGTTHSVFDHPILDGECRVTQSAYARCGAENRRLALRLSDCKDICCWKCLALYVSHTNLCVFFKSKLLGSFKRTVLIWFPAHLSAFCVLCRCGGRFGPVLLRVNVRFSCVLFWVNGAVVNLSCTAVCIHFFVEILQSYEANKCVPGIIWQAALSAAHWSRPGLSAGG